MTFFLRDLCALSVLCVKSFRKSLNTECTEKLHQSSAGCRCQGAKLVACQDLECRLRPRPLRKGAGAFDSFGRCAPFRRVKTPGLLSLPDCSDGRRHSCPVMAQHSDVRASAKRFNCSFAEPIPARNRAHAKIVGENHAVESHAAAQYAVEHGPRNRSR